VPSTVRQIPNRTLRRALLGLNGLSSAWPGDPLPRPSSRSGATWARGMIQRLGFVQVDSICAVERPQHHILFSRNHRYRHEHLETLLVRERRLFENWTHDAAILPAELYPYWRHYFERVKRFEPHPGYRRYFEPVTPRDISRVLRRAKADGPVKPADFGGKKIAFNDDYFAQPTLAKITMELLWRTGRLAVSHRAGRIKVYDLAERIIPDEHLQRRVPARDYVGWVCREALTRLGAGTPAQIARFFDAVTRVEAADWCRRELGRTVREVRIVHADGSTSSTCFALDRVLEALDRVPAPPRGLRLLNPFDPLIHDRRRTLRVFGFDYTVEIWVPPSKRRYGYYVLPILEGERFSGRLDAKVDRKNKQLNVLGVWWEAGVKPTRARLDRLNDQLGKLARFCGARDVNFARSTSR
jgi:uncharacterized protein YcaQ